MNLTATRRVLITGGTGNLGRRVVTTLDSNRAVVPRILSRRERPSREPSHHEWAKADLTCSELGAVVRGVDVVLHLASEKRQGDADVFATERLLRAARAANVPHIVVISIVGCDRIPLPFYMSKRAIEMAVRASGVPWTVIRVTQFHSFVERLVSAAVTLPIPTPIFADLRFQPVDEEEVAEHLVEIALGPPGGDSPDLGGPEVLTLAEIAATWLTVRHRPATLLPVTVDAVKIEPQGVPQVEPWVMGVLEGYRDGLNLLRGTATRTRVTFADWLRRGDAEQAVHRADEQAARGGALAP